jgi:anti-sigma28 factor (negative regulator of flagellin synthesis)
MGIREVTPNASQVGPVKNDGSKKGKPEDRVSKDSVSLSEEAVSKYEALQTKRADEIRERITSGYYFEREVTERVADLLLKDLKTAE